jgi:hypothetical protein
VELLGGESADGLEQRVATLAPDHAGEALLDQRLEMVDREMPVLVAVADLLERG